jgi:hypothetical protein
MTLDEIWSGLTDRVAEIELMLRAIRAATKMEMQLLLKNEEAIKQLPGDDVTHISMHNMSFRDVRTGLHVFYDHRDLTINEAKLHLLLRKNKQYQWLLVEAYEAFEKLLVQLYALVAARGLDCWPMKDYGNITIAEARQKDFHWYLDQARKKKDLPHSILIPLRKNFPAVASAETRNFQNIHLGFAVAMIARLRHQIVHNRGWTESQQQLVLDVAKQVGLYNNGQVAKQQLDFAGRFFGDGEYSNMVALLEVATHPNIPLDTYVCRLGALLDILLGYSNLLVQAVRPHVSEA